eukprot:GHVQ01003352.1.p1 GENE.GHVQ01003352.1~~GHVQ01003352.1.p1  ORF type:complete len:181 (+),score=42.39 GHVQ01003352.1:83-625(+)
MSEDCADVVGGVSDDRMMLGRGGGGGRDRGGENMYSEDRLGCLVSHGERILEEVLNKDLMKMNEMREECSQKIGDLRTLSSNIEFVRDGRLETLQSLLPVGCDVYMEAHVKDTSHIYIETGFQFYLEMTMDEALEFIKIKQKLLQSRLSYWTWKVAYQKTQIQLMMKALSDVMDIGSSLT